MQPIIYTLNNWQVIALTGEMDALFVSEYRELFEKLAAYEGNVLADLSEVHFIDSSGVGSLLFLYKRLRAKNYDMALICDNGQPRELFKILHIDNTLHCYQSLKEFIIADNEK